MNSPFRLSELYSLPGVESTGLAGDLSPFYLPLAAAVPDFGLHRHDRHSTAFAQTPCEYLCDVRALQVVPGTFRCGFDSFRCQVFQAVNEYSFSTTLDKRAPGSCEGDDEASMLGRSFQCCINDIQERRLWQMFT
jgi:hypothetical protein